MAPRTILTAVAMLCITILVAVILLVRDEDPQPPSRITVTEDTCPKWSAYPC